MKRAWLIAVVIGSTAGLALWLGLPNRQQAAPRGATNPLARDETTAAPPPVRAADRPTDAERSGSPKAHASAPNGAQALRDVQSLVDQGKIGAARDLAELYLKRMPPGPETARIESLTGVHPHP